MARQLNRDDGVFVLEKVGRSGRKSATVRIGQAGRSMAWWHRCHQAQHNDGQLLHYDVCAWLSLDRSNLRVGAGPHRRWNCIRKQQSPGTDVGHVRCPPDLLRAVLRVRPEAQCHLRNLPTGMSSEPIIRLAFSEAISRRVLREERMQAAPGCRASPVSLRLSPSFSP